MTTVEGASSPTPPIRNSGKTLAEMRPPILILLAAFVAVVGAVLFVIQIPEATLPETTKFYPITGSEQADLVYRIRSQAVEFVAGLAGIITILLVERRSITVRLKRIPRIGLLATILSAIGSFALLSWFIWWPPRMFLSWQLCSQNFTNANDISTSVLVPCYSPVGDPVPSYNIALSIISLRQQIMLITAAVIAFAILAIKVAGKGVSRTTVERGSTVQRVEAMKRTLLDSSSLIGELQAELEVRTTALERLRAQEDAYEELARLHEREAAAVSVLVEKVITDTHRTLERSSRRDQIVFFVLGVLASVIVTLLFSFH
jgi:hypothetical protein